MDEIGRAEQANMRLTKPGENQHGRKCLRSRRALSVGSLATPSAPHRLVIDSDADGETLKFTYKYLHNLELIRVNSS